MTKMETSEGSLLLLPFYSDPAAPEHEQTVENFAKFAAGAQEVTGLRVAVVDDGAELPVSRFRGIAESVITLPENMGKSYAVRYGLRQILSQPDSPGFIIQYDGDGDQSYVDIPTLWTRLLEESDANPALPTLVIGDRYSQYLSVEPNPASIEYRQTLLTFFGAIARELTGFEGVRDWVSGARGMTAAMAEALVARGRSNRYGLESEELVIAGLIGARVATAPLTISRPRDAATLRTKWLQNFEVYSEHAAALYAEGKGHVVDLIAELVTKLAAAEDIIKLDLNSIGESAVVSLTRDGEWYTASTPWLYRKQTFLDSVSFQLKVPEPEDLIAKERAYAS